MASTVQKPGLPFSVDYRSIGSSTTASISFSNPSAALKFAIAQTHAASTHITLKKWENGSWVIDEDNAKRLVEKLSGKGNPHAANALTQLQELTGVLIKRSSKQNGLDGDTVKAWLEHVFVSAKAMGVIPTAIDQARSQAYGQAQQSTAGQAQQSREPVKP